MVLERTLESPLDSMEIKPVNPKGDSLNIHWTDAEAEAPILRPYDTKNQFTGKDVMLGKTEGRKRRGKHSLRWLDGITDSMATSLSNSRR